MRESSSPSDTQTHTQLIPYPVHSLPLNLPLFSLPTEDEAHIQYELCVYYLTFLTAAELHLQLHSPLLPLVQIIFNLLQFLHDVIFVNVVWFRLQMKHTQTCTN